MCFVVFVKISLSCVCPCQTRSDIDVLKNKILEKIYSDKMTFMKEDDDDDDDGRTIKNNNTVVT